MSKQDAQLDDFPVIHKRELRSETTETTTGGAARVKMPASIPAMDEKLRNILFSGRYSQRTQHVALVLYQEFPQRPSLAELSRITGWHRHTIRDVVFELLNPEATVRPQRQSKPPIAGELCSYCGSEITGIGDRCHHSDHVVARALGGSDEAHNRVPSCQKCNLAKKDKPFLMWLLEIGGRHAS